MSTTTYSLVLPFHAGTALVEKTVLRVLREGGERGVREVLLCHNGRPLAPDAQAKVDALAEANKTPSSAAPIVVRSLHTDAKGIGAGYKLGIREAREPHIILSADDLPFGWTDLDAYEIAGRPDFAIGSKAHRSSRLAGIKGTRRLSTLMFRSLRVMMLGWQTPGDSQGSLIMKTSLAKRLEPRLVYDHYLCSLELATLHLHNRGSIVELPVTIENNDHQTSSISIVKDGIRMAKELFELRQRMKTEVARRR